MLGNKEQKKWRSTSSLTDISAYLIEMTQGESVNEWKSYLITQIPTLQPEQFGLKMHTKDSMKNNI